MKVGTKVKVKESVLFYGGMEGEVIDISDIAPFIFIKVDGRNICFHPDYLEEVGTTGGAKDEKP